MQFRRKLVGFPVAIILAGYAAGTQFALAGSNPYAPLGVHMGSFYLYPVVEIGVGYDDNVFRLPDVDAGDLDTSASDTAAIMRASVTANSDWSRHALNGMATIDVAKYDQHSSENFGNYALTADGQLDIKRGSYASARVGYASSNESRSSVDSREGTDETPLVYGVEPTRYAATSAGVGYDYKPAKLGFSFDLDYQTLDYEDITNFDGEIIDNSDRDRSRTAARVRVGYEVMPQRSVYIETVANQVDYDRPVDNNGVERSSSGYEVTSGINFDLSNLLIGDVFIGYLEQNYNDPGQSDISSNLVGLGLQWFPSRLTSVNLELDRRVQESTEATVSGYLSTVARIGVAHELKRNIVLSADADRIQNDFEQSDPDGKEQERIVGFGLKGKYLISRRWYSSLEYRYENRDSDIELQEYTNNRGLFKLGAQW